MARLTANYNYNESDNTNINENYNCDRYLNPMENVPFLQVKMAMLVARKKFFREINTRVHSELLSTWITSVENLQPAVQDLVVGGGRVEFANHVASLCKAVEELEKQASNLVEELEKQGHNLYKSPPTAEPPRHDTPRLIGLECNLTKTLECIVGTEWAVIGIVGACGIGKTTLLREIKKIVRSNAEKKYPFSKVILVHVTKTLNIEKIQDKIAESLGLVVEGEKKFSELDLHKRADKLLERLAKETFLIMLDDVWNAVSFREIGIPILPETSNHFEEGKSQSKIVYTTRSKAICALMSPHVTVAMEPLSPSHSLELFKAHSKNVSKEIVHKIIEKCAGLPLALITVGFGTAERDLDRIYYCLNNSPTEIYGMKADVLHVLKPSFDSLIDDVTKRCFLFCALFQDSKDINRNRLVDYWIGEGLVHDRCQGNDSVKQLLGCFLLDAPDSTHVKMHNIVRSMTVWLAKECPDEKHQFQFHAGEKFDQSDMEKMKWVKRASFVDSATELRILLKHLPDCNNLVTLLMCLCESRWESHRKEPESSLISKGFYNFFHKDKMPECRVLDMAHQPISKLPSKLCYITSLQYLNLSYTFIDTLPTEIGKLVQLTQLDLSGTKHLRKIPHGAISPLSSLKSLKLFDSDYSNFNSKGQFSLEHLEGLIWLVELQLPLQNLETLKRLAQYTRLSKLATYLQLKLDCLDLTKSEIFKLFVNLKELSIRSYQSKSKGTDREIKINFNHFLNLETLILRDQSKISQVTFMSTKPILLRKLHISSCTELKRITCLCQLQNLEILEIFACEKMVELLSWPCGTNVTRQTEDEIAYKHQEHTQCLTNLRLLKLDFLLELASVSHCDLPFRCLEEISIASCPKLEKIQVNLINEGCLKVICISRCPKLKKLEVNPTNEGNKIKLSCEKTWWEELQRDDGVTNPSSFLVSF